MKINLDRLLLTLLFLCIDMNAEVNLRSSNSTIKISGEGKLVLDTPLTNFSGTLVQTTTNSVQGQTITFDQGFLQQASGRRSVLSGVLDPSIINNCIQLAGAQTFRGNGNALLSSVLVSGKDNRLEGDLLLGGPVTLQDSSTTLTLALLRKATQNIILNGGTIFLEEDLAFADGYQLLGTGTVLFNRHKLKFGALPITIASPLTFINGNDLDLQGNLHLTTTLVLVGPNTFNGNGNILYLDPGAFVSIQTSGGLEQTASSLTLKAITVQGLAGTNIFCQDNTGKIIMQDAFWIQTANFRYPNGSIDILGDMNCMGAYTFYYNTSQTSTIEAFSMLALEPDFVFSYAPAANRKKLISFIDKTSELNLNGGTLHVSTTGMQLTKGTMVVNGSSRFSNSALTPNGGIILGDGLSAANDFTIQMLPNSVLDMTSGFLVNKNIV